ncbi:hypothetical protein VKT23_013579 [Stygiomarasmius scandens]|uniref:Methyltransferase domain-containing protein n=1 Tax=Marasmiellus scandens TaxID=2682957 RepID=A0ABR1J3C8_9AGAR
MKSDKTALFLDAGCCFGTDIRKAIADGCPAENIIGLDLHQEFWGLGHKLFRSNPDKMASTFIAGSILDPSFVLEVDSPEKQNLAPFKGKFKFIHASNFFHLFQEEDQKKTAEHLAALLSPTPGSMIFGSHVSLPEKASSWTDLWKTIIPGDGIKVDAKVIEEPKIVPESRINETYRLMWSITRL